MTGCSGLEITPDEGRERPVSVITGKTGGIKISDLGSKKTN